MPPHSAFFQRVEVSHFSLELALNCDTPDLNLPLVSDERCTSLFPAIGFYGVSLAFLLRLASNYNPTDLSLLNS
jgi:hypothetical protein